MDVGFQLRAPWYVRERHDWTVHDPRAKRPEIQMYDNEQFVDRLMADPGTSVKFGDDDLWSYPVPVTPSTTAKGRARFATSQLIRTDLRKLYQPSHGRFYVVVVEVFCDSPGLPRAGSHSDIEVSMVMRRQFTSVSGDRRPVRRLARNLLVELAKKQQLGDVADASAMDLPDIWWADAAWRRRFEEDNAKLFAEVTGSTDDQAWMVGTAGGQWRTATTPPAKGRPPDSEQEFPMWRLPPRKEDCEAARTRSLWFGVIPTFSADHWTTDETKIEPKLDDHAIYQMLCLVRQPPPPGHEHCPPTVYPSAPSEPFRLADPSDPDGTKNRTVSITLPDLRRLAARAGQKQGPGGVHITTPPNSHLPPIPFKKIPSTGSGKVGDGGQICTFAFELFFIVAFFLFLLFLPIVIFVFQLWWMLALKFCIPPSISFQVLAKFFADAHLLADLKLNAQGQTGFPNERNALDELLGVTDDLKQPGASAADLLIAAPDFAATPDPLPELIDAIHPDKSVAPVVPTPMETTPPDPLCPSPPS